MGGWSSGVSVDVGGISDALIAKRDFFFSATVKQRKQALWIHVRPSFHLSCIIFFYIGELSVGYIQVTDTSHSLVSSNIKCSFENPAGDSTKSK